MSARFIITGTDTGVGKTVFAAALTNALNADYWKPIQAGFDNSGEGGTDSEIIAQLSGANEDRIFKEGYVLTTPCSPHRAAELDGIEMDADRLSPPDTTASLVIEGAGGLLVPITRNLLQVELFKTWSAPVIVCARTGLGTINHTLLSLEALKSRDIPLLGIAFIGEANEDSEKTICEISGTKRLGRLPHISPLQPAALKNAFADAFDLEDFA